MRWTGLPVTKLGGVTHAMGTRVPLRPRKQFHTAVSVLAVEEIMLLQGVLFGQWQGLSSMSQLGQYNDTCSVQSEG